MNANTTTEKTTSEKYIDGLSVAIDALYRGATATTIASVTGMVANMKDDLELPRIANRNDAYGRRVRKAMVAMIARADNALKTSTAA